MSPAARTYRPDVRTERHGDVVIGGSPLRLFRLTGAGRRVVQTIERGDPVEQSGLVDTLLDAGAIHPTVGHASRFTADDVTVVVPAHGEPAQVPNGAVVVDDGTDPPIPGATIRLSQNRGPAAARNAGLAAVDTALVAFVDADVQVDPDWLQHLLPHFDDDRVGMVAPRVVSPAGRSMIARHDAAHSPLDLGREAARVRSGSRVSYVPAAALLARTDAVRGVGGFDDAMRFGEDVDLVWRLDEAGWRIRYEPDATVRHTPRATWAGWVRQRVGYGSSAAPLAQRHPGALAPVRLSGWSIGSWVAALAVHPLVGVVISAGSAGALVRKLPDVPPKRAFRLAWLGNLHAGSQLALAVRRVWWPILAVLSIRSRFARRALAAALLAARDPLVVVDDAAYSLGVWRGMLEERSAAPLVPEISSWPGRRPQRRHEGAP